MKGLSRIFLQVRPGDSDCLGAVSSFDIELALLNFTFFEDFG